MNVENLFGDLYNAPVEAEVCVWAVGFRDHRLACVARNFASSGHDGRGWLYGFGGKRRIVWIVVEVSCRRRQHALSVDLHTQRCCRKPSRVLAALGVFGTGTGWPDVIVAAIMAALQDATTVVQQSLKELCQPAW
jgi:hypothetical protein